MRGRLAALAMAALTAAPLGADAAGATRTILTFDDLHGWARDDHAAALRVFETTCPQLDGPAWAELCEAATDATDARAFFEANFVPVLIRDDRKPLFTGYYEPELAASRHRTATYRYPIYRPPGDLPRGRPWLTRREIDESDALGGRGLELAWLADPVDVYFLHVQGSGRLRLPDGHTMRVGYAARNGHKYHSIGREMAAQGLLPAHRVSAHAIRDWVHSHPEQGREILWTNPSYIFFREIDLPEAAGPLGAMSRPVTPLRSLAVDPDWVPLGAPVWVEKRGRKPLDRLMIAQDTGSAIRGPQRADIFYGSGPAAGKAAGHVRDGGRMVVLFPRALVPGG